MNKSLQILILIIIAALILFFVDYCTTNTIVPGNSIADREQFTNEKSLAFDTLAVSAWNKAKYLDLVLELNTYFDQKVITVSQKTSLDDYLQISYAKSLVKSCDDWINGNCQTSPTNLYTEMSKVFNIVDCKPILKHSISLIQNYNLALQLPGRVNSFIQLEYDENNYNSLLKKINHLCGIPGIRSCKKIQLIKSEKSAILNKFKNFVVKYTVDKDLYDRDPGDYNYMADLLSDCPDNFPDIKNYTFYYNQIISLNLCNESWD